MQHAVLDERGEDEDEAHGHEQVHGRHVGHLGKGLPGDGTQRGHGQHRGDAWGGGGGGGHWDIGCQCHIEISDWLLIPISSKDALLFCYSLNSKFPTSKMRFIVFYLFAIVHNIIFKVR